MSAAMLKVFAATSRNISAQYQPTGRQLHHVGGETLAGYSADRALTSWIAIMNGVVRNTVQSKP
jgi:hypothetical protein